MLNRLLLRSARRFTNSTHSHELSADVNFTQRRDSFEKFYSRNEPLSGSCSAVDSLSYSKRNSGVDKGNFKVPIGSDLTISSLGVGTYTNED